MNSPKKKKSYGMSSILNKANLIAKVFPQGEKQTLKEYFKERLEKLFDSPPSNLGYKEDIESLLNDLGITKETLLQMTINILSKTVRNKQEVKTVASYLFFMQDFLKLVKAKGGSEKETILLKDLLTMSEAMIYEKQPNNTVLMRFGEKGSTAYIILDGQVDVLIETSSIKNLGEKSYLYYLANLIRYHEFGLVNSTINDNFKKYPIEIIDDISIKPNTNTLSNKDKKTDTKKDNINNDKNSSNYSFNIRRDKTQRFTKRIKDIEGENDDNIETPYPSSPSFKRNESKKGTSQPKSVFRLNFMNEELKDLKKVKQYRARELLAMFGLKLLDKRFNKRLNRCSTDDYIQRLNIFEYLENKQKELEEKKSLKNYINSHRKENININENEKNIQKTTKEEDLKENMKNENENKILILKKEGENEDDSIEGINNQSASSSSSSDFMFEMNHNMIFGLKIFTYMKVVTLGVGSLFGEMALNDSNALRKAAIITSSNCHFSVLNKKTFNNCIKMGAQKHLRELLQFFIELPIFNGIPEGVFYHKYYTNLSKITIVKGKNIINQGEKPEYITLLKTGSYGVTTRMSLYELTRLIFKYAKYFNINNEANELNKNANANNKKDNTNNINDIKAKYRLLFQNVINIMNEENMLLNDNIIFKKYYYSQQFIRIAEISCPEVIINEEYLDDNGLFAFSIEAKSPENIIYTLSNSFYDDLKEKNISVRKNQDRLLSKKINVMIHRLLIVRNSLISSFFDYKSRSNVGNIVIRELEEMIFMQLKKKRSLVKKDEKIILTNENENKENNKEIKEKDNFIYINTNSNGSNSYLIKNKKNDLNKYQKEASSPIIENNSYNIKNSKNMSALKLFKDIEKNAEKEQKSNKNIFNKKINSFQKNKNAKFSDNQLKMYKNILSSSMNKKLNITNKDLNAVNQLPFKDNEVDILFSLYDKNDTEGKYSINNYNNKMSNTNYYISRNQKNEFAHLKNKIENKTIFNSFGNNSDVEKRNNVFATKKVVINNLIWENLKSVIKNPTQQQFNLYNSNRTSNNFYKNKKINKSNLRNYLENNLKCVTNRYQQKSSMNSKTEENKIIKASTNINPNINTNEQNNSLTKQFSFKDFKIENNNNIYLLSSPSRLKKVYLSTFKNKNNKNKNRVKESEKQPMLNLKKYKKNDLPKIKIKLKKFYSPQEINFMRMSLKRRYVIDGNKNKNIKAEKFQINRNDYYKKNLINRMNFFYGFSPEEK